MKKKDHNLCELKGCYETYYITYYHHKICLNHWKRHAEGKINLKAIFNIPMGEVGSEALKTILNPIQAKLQ